MVQQVAKHADLIIVTYDLRATGTAPVMMLRILPSRKFAFPRRTPNSQGLQMDMTFTEPRVPLISSSSPTLLDKTLLFGALPSIHFEISSNRLNLATTTTAFLAGSSFSD